MPRPLVVVAALATVACGMMAAPPSDEEMTTRFRGDRGAFESLRETLRGSAALSNRQDWLMNQSDLDRMSLEPATADALRKAFLELKLEWIRGNGPADGKIEFVTWAADIPRPGPPGPRLRVGTVSPGRSAAEPRPRQLRGVHADRRQLVPVRRADRLRTPRRHGLGLGATVVNSSRTRSS